MAKVTTIPGKYDGCFYIRCYLPGIELGWNMPKQIGHEMDNMQAFRMAMESDVIIFQRPSDKDKVDAIRLLKMKGKKIIFDNDDTYLPGEGIPYEKLSKQGREIAETMNANLYEAIKLSDAVTCTTEYLAEEYRKLHDNVHVIPNAVSEVEMETKIPNDTGKKRIGLVGSVLSNDDYLHVKDAIKRLKDDGHQFVIFGIKRKDGTHNKAYDEDVKFWEDIDPEWIGFRPMTQYYHTLNKMKVDVLMIPRNDSYFNRCKSNLKFLEASLMGIPVVAQAFDDEKSPYQANPQDKEHMLLATDSDDWYNKVTEALEDPSFAAGAQDYVLENYNIRKVAKQWRDLIDNL